MSIWDRTIVTGTIIIKSSLIIDILATFYIPLFYSIIHLIVFADPKLKGSNLPPGLERKFRVCENE